MEYELTVDDRDDFDVQLKNRGKNGWTLHSWQLDSSEGYIYHAVWVRNSRQ